MRPNISPFINPDLTPNSQKKARVPKFEISGTSEKQFKRYLDSSRYLKHELPRSTYVSLMANPASNLVFVASGSKVLSYTLEDYDIAPGPSKETLTPTYLTWSNDQLAYFGDYGIHFCDARLNETKKLDGKPGEANWAQGGVSQEKQVWPGGGKSIALVRLDDCKKKVFKGFWDDVGRPIYAEYCSKIKMIVGVAGPGPNGYSLLVLDTISKVRSVISITEHLPERSFGSPSHDCHVRMLRRLR